MANRQRNYGGTCKQYFCQVIAAEMQSRGMKKLNPQANHILNLAGVAFTRYLMQQQGIRSGMFATKNGRTYEIFPPEMLETVVHAIFDEMQTDGMKP